MEFVKCNVVSEALHEVSEYNRARRISRIKGAFNGVLETSGINTDLLRMILRAKKDTRVVYVSFVSERFSVTFNDCGLIFETEKKPAVIFPVENIELYNIAWAASFFLGKKKGVLADIKKQFVFKDMASFRSRFKGKEEVAKEWHRVREKYGIKSREAFKYHTEIVFVGEVPIVPKALFGITRRELVQLAELAGKVKYSPLDLPVYKSAMDYFTKKQPIILPESNP
ncbi:MAG: hypothetical protein ABIF92_02395 [archaeon]